MTALLLCRSGNDAGLAHRIGAGRCLVGRSTACHFALLDPDLSREHCLISERTGTGWVVEDLESSNGTFVNGQRVDPKEARLLRHCDFLTLGSSLEFVFLDLDRVPSSEVVAAAIVGPDGHRVPLQLGENTLGSSGDCDLVVEDSSIRPSHLRLTLSATELRAECEADAVPFHVRGMEVRAAALRPGDLLVLTPTAEFGVDVVMGEGPASLRPDAQATWRALPQKGEDTGSRGSLPPVSPTEETRIAGVRTIEEGDSTASLPASDLAASLQKARERHAQMRASGQEGESTGGAAARRAQEAHEDAAGLRRTWAARSAPAPVVAQQPAHLRATRREAAARIHVVFKGDRGPEERVTLLREGTHVVGRQEDCRVWVNDLSVSRHHAEIHVGPQGIVIKDLGSANGTWRENERISELKVAAGAHIRFGSVTAWFDEI